MSNTDPLAGLMEMDDPPKLARPPRAPRYSRPVVSSVAVNPDLDKYANEIVGAVKARGFDVRLGSGVRTPDEQAQKVAQGYSRTMNSKHLTGHARDFVVFDAQGNYIKDGSHPAYKAIGEEAKKRGLEWGGDWKSFYDPSHVQLPAASVPRQSAVDPLAGLMEMDAGTQADASLVAPSHPRGQLRRPALSEVAQAGASGSVAWEEEKPRLSTRPRRSPFAGIEAGASGDSPFARVRAGVSTEKVKPRRLPRPVARASGETPFAVAHGGASGEIESPSMQASDERGREYMEKVEALQGQSRFERNLTSGLGGSLAGLDLEAGKAVGLVNRVLPTDIGARIEHHLRDRAHFINQAIESGSRAQVQAEGDLSLGDKIVRGVSAAPLSLLKSAMWVRRFGPVFGLAADGAIEGSDEGLRGAAKGAVVGALTGGLLHVTAPLSKTANAIIQGLFGGGLTAIEGGNTSDIVSGAVTQGTLGAMGGRDETTLRGLPEYYRSRAAESFRAETAGRAPSYTPEQLAHQSEVRADVLREQSTRQKQSEMLARGEVVKNPDGSLSLSGVETPAGRADVRVRPRAWEHRNYGRVVEAENQARVGRGRVRVEDEQGAEHIIREADGNGRGNNLAVPVRDASPVLDVTDPLASLMEQNTPVASRPFVPFGVDEAKFRARLARSEYAPMADEFGPVEDVLYQATADQRARREVIPRLIQSLKDGRHPTTGKPFTEAQRKEVEADLNQLRSEYRDTFRQVNELFGPRVLPEFQRRVHAYDEPVPPPVSAPVESPVVSAATPSAPVVTRPADVTVAQPRSAAPDPLAGLLVSDAPPAPSLARPAASAGGGAAPSPGAPLHEFLSELTGSPAPASLAPARPSLARRVGSTALDAAGAPRSLMASGDVSAPGRQLFPLLVTEPVETVRALNRTKGAFRSARHEVLRVELEAHPDAQLAQDSGLRLTMLAPDGHEEMFTSKLARKIPTVGASERIMEAQLDFARLGVFSKYAKAIRAKRLPAEETGKALRDIAGYVNIASGYGELPARGRALFKLVNHTIFSPRLAISRFQMLNPVRYARMSPVARSIAARKAMQFVGTVGGAVGLAYAAGLPVGVDPDSADFLKLKVGKTHYDLSGGFGNTLRFMFRFVRGVEREATGQKMEEKDKPVNVVTQFLRQKLAPLPSYAVDAATGKKVTGEEFDALQGAVERVTPLFAQDLYGAWTAEGGSTLSEMATRDWYPNPPQTGFVGAAKALPSFFGAGVQSYESKQKYERPPDERNLLLESDTPAARELKRLKVMVKPLGNPSTAVSNGEHAKMFPSDNTASFSVPEVEEARRVYYEELERAVSSVVSDPAYQSFRSDGERSHYLEQVLKGARGRALNAVRLKLRTNQVGDTERVRAMQNRLSERRP